MKKSLNFLLISLSMSLGMSLSWCLIAFDGPSETTELLVNYQTAKKDYNKAQERWDKAKGLELDKEYYNKAQTDFDTAKNLFELRKNHIKKYYRDGGYQKDLESISQKAREYLKNERDIMTSYNSNAMLDHKYAIVFDIDDTALIAYTENVKEFSFLWDTKDEALKSKELSWKVNKSVLDLYNDLLAMGYKMIFISSRFWVELSFKPPFVTKMYDVVSQRLYAAGYTKFDKLILKQNPLEFGNTAKWKLEQRKKLVLEDGYEIIGCVGDREKDFYGGYTGYQVKLPNYLYN